MKKVLNHGFLSLRRPFLRGGQRTQHGARASQTKTTGKTSLIMLLLKLTRPDQTQNRKLKSDQFVLQGDGEEEEEEEEDGKVLKTDQSSTAKTESGRKEPRRADLAERDDNVPLHRVIILGSAEVNQNQCFFT